MTDPCLLELSGSQHALLARRQVRDAGLSRDAWRHLRDGPDWEAVTGEVIRWTGAPVTDRQRAMAIVLDAGAGAVLSHRSAGWLWGIAGCSMLPLTVTTARSSRRRTELGVTHRVQRLDVGWTTVLDGIPVVRPELLAMHLFDVCHEAQAERYVERLWSLRVLTGPSIAHFLGLAGERGRNGTAALRRYLEPRGADYVPPASGLESRFGQLMREAGLPFRRQVDSGGESWTGRVDFRHESRPVIAEIQSGLYHGALVDEVADAARVAQLRGDGFEVVEITDVDVWTRPRHVVEQVRSALRAL